MHFTAENEWGPYWSVTKYNDIMTVDTNHGVFSSEGNITVVGRDEASSCRASSPWTRPSTTPSARR